jgi:copper resistance protein D
VDELIAITRALHFSAVIVLFGQFVFLFVISRPEAPPPLFDRAVAWSLGMALATALAWLALEARTMSGLPLKEALQPETLTIVLTQTLFGRMWLLRIVLAAVLCVALVAKRRARGLLVLSAFFSAVVLATLAAMGHGAAERGVDRILHLCADALHLLAAGAWLGALVPLVLVLERCSYDAKPDALALAARATRRFSTLGIACMAALLLSGVVNASYTVRELPVLFASQYGRLLLGKVALYVLIVAVAGVNRMALMPRLAVASVDSALALRRLRANAILETCLGFAIIAIVGKIGITIPAMHAH